jgi:hypothetical protein
MKLSVTEQVRTTYTVEIPDDTPEEEIDSAIAEAQPPRSEWCENVEERTWEKSD